MDAKTARQKLACSGTEEERIKPLHAEGEAVKVEQKKQMFEKLSNRRNELERSTSQQAAQFEVCHELNLNL